MGLPWAEGHAYWFCYQVGCGEPWGFRCSKHGVWLVRQVSPEVLRPVGIETMLSNREVGWGDWSSAGMVLALSHVADLLSMVLGENRLLQGLQNAETMLRTPEAPGVSRHALHHRSRNTQRRCPVPLFHVRAVWENQRRVMKGLRCGV